MTTIEGMDHSVKSREFHISIKASSHESHAVEDDMDDTEVELEQSTWENIVYLPFGQNWNYLIVSTTIFNFGMNCMNIVYKLSEESYVPTVLYYAFETIYLIHTIAQLIHKKAVALRKKRYFHAVSTGILCLNILSLFPFFEIYFLLNVYTWDYRPPVDKTRLKVGVRLLPVFTYCASKKRDVGVQQIVVVVLNQVLLMSLIITILSCAWYQFKDIRDPDRVEGNWVYYLRDYQYQKNNTVHWMIICVHVISSFFAHNSLGPVYGITPTEKIFVLIIIFCGFFLFFMIFFGELTAAYIQSYWHHYEYTARLKKIVYLLNDWRVDREVQKKTIEYYTVFWERRLGMKDMPVAFEMLPISMRKDITMDIFWDCFRHSHIFESTSMAVKRSISMVMKNEFLLPGDYLLKTGQLKTKMVYIVSGVVQVLTDEDNESPVLSFSSGTLLGETCCLRAIVSQANVKCATYCELHTLHMVDLYRVLSNNIEMARYFIHCAATRVEDAKRIREDVTAIRRGLGFDNDDTSIMRLKKQWRLVSSLATGKKYDESMWKKLDKTFNSKFLDLMVLSQEVELKVQAVCLSSKCPPVMDPNSSFRVFCEYIIIGSACIQFVLLPFAVYAHQDEMQVMKSIMERRLVGLDLYTRFVNILDFNWHYNEGAEIHGSNGIFNDGSEKLKTEIINERIASVLRMVPLFDVLGEDLIRCLSMNMRVTILPAGTPLVEHGATVLTVYVILRGYCSMQSHLPGDRERRVVITLKKGDILAPIEMLHRLYSVSSVATITAVEIMQMPYDVFKDILRSHRAEYQFIQKTLQEHLHVYHNLLQKTSCRMPVLKSLKPALGKTDAFEYKLITRKERYGREEYLKPFQEIEWGCVRYLMLRTTVNPKSRAFLCWEITRTTTILVDIVATILSIYILRDHTYYTDIAVTISRAAAAIDIYIRFHCQYYNRNGILVTHPLYTAKYYLHSAFFTDVISALPLTFMQIAEMFGRNNLTRSKGIIRLMTRPIQLYRPFLAISYLESSLHWSKGSILMKIKYTGLLFVMLGIYANIMLMYTCEYYTINSTEVVNCTATNNWLSRSNLTQISQASFMNFAQTIYFTVSIFANTLCGTYKSFTTTETKMLIVIVTSLHMLRIVVLAKFISSTVGGNINLSIYQARMKQFLKFAKEVKMSQDLIKETIAHNEYVWKETQGTSVVDVCNKLNLYLRVKFVCFLYEETLRSTSLFVALSQYSLQRLALNLAEVHFKKDAEIIRCNDVQSNLYIVYKGRVDVIIANVVISTLEIGGIFGCFSRGGLLRQTLTVRAKVHTIVLVIDSREFHKVMMPWENEQARKVIRDIRILCACFHTRCAYVDIDGFKSYTTNTLDSVLIAYTYVINSFTSTGLNNVRPMSLREVLVATLVVTYIQYTIAALASGFVTLIIIEDTILSNYKYNIERLNIYLKSHYLSPAILQNVWAYLLQLWKIQRGEWMPMLIRNAPSYLRQDIMKSLYMTHLENHFLFGKTHKHFLRQLVVHFERCIYFPGNYIVAKGDMDNTMYFIHKGEVGAYDCDESNREIYLHTLGTNMSFGEAQGINQIPFEVSYKALSTVEVLALRRVNWQYLLTWFPASEEELIRRSGEYGLSTGPGLRAEEQVEF
ncbi:cyclic nucleotide-gated cation channel subunit a [Holotrichia oblita]|uniref:Cyclic nucleotide-gated cation channel subunit a n=1 Tax=Holotrichia oblita TaxID=644536 RepID=A0ACB9T1J6_HOLOL|nr:cyclic nucleotide-gated cation channel subunit a [Holotrichia oblita]